jgi:putative nucleotidyltransferase with HDIG domain
MSKDPKVRQIWAHSVATALAAHHLADELGLINTDEAFVAGMLHDVGKMVIYHQHPEPYAQVLELARANEIRVLRVENQAFKFFTHETIGGLVVKKWRLSDELAECARYHHIVEATTPSCVNHPMLVSLVSVASIIANNLGYGIKVCEWSEVPGLHCAETINLSADKMGKMVERIAAVCEEQRQVVA